MPLNDDTRDDFSNHLEDEHIWDAHAPPGIEMLGVRIQSDRGSGSFAEDGQLEVAEDDVAMNGETGVGGSAAESGQSEIGAGLASEEGQSEIGDWSPEQGYMLGAGAIQAPFESFMMGPTGMGDWSPEQGHMVGAGHAAMDGQSEIGSYAMYGPTEIGSYAMYGPTEIGSYAMYGPTEIGAAAAHPAVAVAKVVETARDNRQPAPPMRVVDEDAPPADEGYDEDVTEFLVGAAMATGGDNLFPLTTQFMQRCGSGCLPRYVRVDTEETYKQMRTQNSPELSELAARVSDLESKLAAHVADIHAHGTSPEDAGDLSDDMEDLVMLGAEAQASEESKHIELWMPQKFDGLVTAWREGDFVCASLALPGQNGEVRICTSLEPIRKCVEEMSKHVAESGVPAAAVVGVLPAMGCVLGAGTVMKEVAAAAKDIVKRPEMAGDKPFIVRIEPKINPALSALAMLAMACNAGDKQACNEWAALGKYSPAPVRQAMTEALALAKAAS